MYGCWSWHRFIILLPQIQLTPLWKIIRNPCNKMVLVICDANDDPRNTSIICDNC